MGKTEDIASALACFTTNQRRCEGCAYNPHPGMAWPYGCVAGQRHVIEDTKAQLIKLDRENESLLEYALGRGGRTIEKVDVETLMAALDAALAALSKVGDAAADRLYGARYWLVSLFRPDEQEDFAYGKERWEEMKRER